MSIKNYICLLNVELSIIRCEVSNIWVEVAIILGKVAIMLWQMSNIGAGVSIKFSELDKVANIWLILSINNLRVSIKF